MKSKDVEVKKTELTEPIKKPDRSAERVIRNLKVDNINGTPYTPYVP